MSENDVESDRAFKGPFAGKTSEEARAWFEKHAEVEEGEVGVGGYMFDSERAIYEDTPLPMPGVVHNHLQVVNSSGHMPYSAVPDPAYITPFNPMNPAGPFTPAIPGGPFTPAIPGGPFTPAIPGGPFTPAIPGDPFPNVPWVEPWKNPLEPSPFTPEVDWTDLFKRTQDMRKATDDATDEVARLKDELYFIRNAELILTSPTINLPSFFNEDGFGIRGALYKLAEVARATCLHERLTLKEWDSLMGYDMGKRIINYAELCDKDDAIPTPDQFLQNFRDGKYA